MSTQTLRADPRKPNPGGHGDMPKRKSTLWTPFNLVILALALGVIAAGAYVARTVLHLSLDAHANTPAVEAVALEAGWKCARDKKTLDECRAQMRSAKR